VSGRGVGMDVVKTNIEKIAGSLDVSSIVGAGTTLTIRIPLTLAIVPALIVNACGSRFAIPQPNLVELVRLRDDAALELIDGAAFHRLRGQLLPVLDLAGILCLAASAATESRRSARTLAVVQVDGIQFGLLVDRVNDAEEIVVKPLGRHLKSTEVFAGCTIMGDGSVALILDVMAIARQSRLSAANQHTTEAVASTSVTDSLLLCHVGGARVAIPLARVARLEHVEPDRIDLAGSQEVVTYGDTLLPLVRLTNLIGVHHYADEAEGARLKMVVTSEDAGCSVGLVVDEITDAIEVAVESISLQGGGNRFGVLGTAVINGVVLDIEGVTATVDPSYFERRLLSV
jgi:two-component system, chemotaxis family, sensor kinase CheA